MSPLLNLRNLHGFIVVEEYAEQQEGKFCKLSDTLLAYMLQSLLSRLKRVVCDNNRTASIVV